jgi:hypothetical protein
MPETVTEDVLAGTVATTAAGETNLAVDPQGSASRLAISVHRVRDRLDAHPLSAGSAP